MLKKIKQREDGDTIVEVLISLAILTTILVGAYYTANQSYRNDRDSVEHTQALTIAQTQVEDLRTAGSLSPGDQCFNSSGTGTSNCYIPDGNTSENLSQTNCQSLSGNYCYSIDVFKYASVNFSIPVSPPVPNVTFNTYEVYVTWQALGGSGKDNITLYYRQDST